MSDLQQLEETIPTLTESSKIEPKNWQENLQEKQALALGRTEMLGRLMGAETLRRGLRDEDAQRTAWMKDNHKLIYGGDSEGAKTKSEDDDMGDINLGDRTEHHYHPKKSNKLLGAALVAAGVITGGAGLALLPSILDSFKPETPEPIETIREKVIEGTSEGLKVLPPKIIKPD